MKPHQERVIAEKTELDAKIEKLTAFLAGAVYPTLSRDEQNRLKWQRQYMRAYSQVLGERIAAF